MTIGCATDDEDPATECPVYRLKDTEGATQRDDLPIQGSGVGRGREPGRPRPSSIASSSKGTGWICTLVLSLKEGPYTDLGTIVSMGTAFRRERSPAVREPT